MQPNEKAPKTAIFGAIKNIFQSTNNGHYKPKDLEVKVVDTFMSRTLAVTA